MDNEVFKPLNNGIKIFAVAMCFIAAFASYLSKNWLLGIAWTCCGYWQSRTYRLMEENKKLKEKSSFYKKDEENDGEKLG